MALLKPHMPKFSRKVRLMNTFTQLFGVSAISILYGIHFYWFFRRWEMKILPSCLVGGNDLEVWINEESCKACCKYHQRLHNQKKQEELQTQRRRESLERSAEGQQKQQADIHAAI